VVSTGFASGTSPSGILEDKTGTHLYVTDSILNQVWTYTIASGIPTVAGTASTDAQPMGMAFDLTGKYLYVTAYTANALDLYTLNASGLPVRSSMISVQTGTGPTCVTVSGAPTNSGPTHAEYLYTSNQLNATLTGEQVNQTDGTLTQLQGSPYSGSALPTCTVTVPAFPQR
jgi:6-phosphogluconolactonase